MADVTYDSYKVVFPDGLKKALERFKEATREYTQKSLEECADRVSARGMVREVCGEAVTHDEQEALRLAEKHGFVSTLQGRYTDLRDSPTAADRSLDPKTAWQLVREVKGLLNAGESPQGIKRILMGAGHSPDVARHILDAAWEQRLREKEALFAKNYGMGPEKLEKLMADRAPKANVQFPIKEQPYPSDAAIVEEYSKFLLDLDQRKHAPLDDGFYLDGHMITLEMAREAWSRELKRRLAESEDKRKLHAQKDYPEEWW